MTRFRAIHLHLPLTSALLVLGASQLRALDFPSFQYINAPGVSWNANGEMEALKGFVIPDGDLVMLGDALRVDFTRKEFFATGHVVYVMPGLRLHADRLGYNQKTDVGDAWNVTVYVEQLGHRMVITADHAHFDRLDIVLYGVHSDAGHGGVLSLTASKAHIYLREKPATNRTGFEKQVAGIAVVSPTLRFIDVPVLYAPYLYRDFVEDYPYTRLVVASTTRLGELARGWVATDLPPMLGWQPRLEARGDDYSRTGKGYGFDSIVRDPTVGEGTFEWFNTPNEHVMGGPSDNQTLETRSSHVLDLEQTAHAQVDGWGAGAFYGRYVTTPEPDPIDPFNPPQTGSDTRYRSDYLRDDVDHRPFARQGVTGAWTWPLASLVLDTQHRDQVQLQTTDRAWSVEASMPQTAILGEIQASGDVWTQDLSKEFSSTSALRTTYIEGLSLLHWSGPVGLDASVGTQGLMYDQGRIDGVELPGNEERWLPYANTGVRLRIAGDYGDGLLNTITPRIGFQALGGGHGDTLQDFDFGDPLDTLIEDKRYLLTGLDTAVTKTRTLFNASLLATWALRDQDHDYLDTNGNLQRARTDLVSITGLAQGSPISTVNIVSTFDYDAQNHSWAAFNTTASWIADPSLIWRYTGTLIPPDSYHTDIWQQTPGVTVIANRYRYDLDLTFEPGGGRLVEGISINASRRMLEGIFTVFFEEIRNPDGGLYDERVGVGFSTTFSSAASTQAVRPAHSTGMDFH